MNYDEWVKRLRPDDVVLVWNCRGDAIPALMAANTVGCRRVMMELGYMKRAKFLNHRSGYFQVVADAVAPGELQRYWDGRRWGDLGLEIEEAPYESVKERIEDLPSVLFLGQCANDGQHGICEEGIIRELMKLWSARSRTDIPSDVEVKFRPHPKYTYRETDTAQNTFTKWTDPHDIPLEAEMRQSGVVFALNSTSGFEALRMGVPVISAFFASYWGAAMRFYAGPRGDRRPFFDQVACSQFLLSEIEEGIPQEYLSL